MKNDEGSYFKKQVIDVDTLIVPNHFRISYISHFVCLCVWCLVRLRFIYSPALFRPR